MKNKVTSAFLLLRGFVSKGHPRSVKAKKNILASLVIKGVSVAVSLAFVPLTINYVNSTRYGIWLILSSVIAWFGYFDIGFGNGLKNKFAESIAKKDHETARIYLSTTYAILTALAIVVTIVFVCVNPFINWAKILNAPPEMGTELKRLSLIIFIFFWLQFIFQLITTILAANQDSAKAAFFNLLGNILALIIIFILTKTTEGNLIYLGCVLSSTPLLVMIGSSLWFYNREYKVYAPSFKYIDFRYAKNLMSLGVSFFIIQICALVLFQTDNIIITQLFNPKEVTIFNVAYKLFSVITIAFSIIITPLWSAFTEAYTNQDSGWIKTTLSKLRKFWILLVLITTGMLIASPLLFKIWMGDKVKIPFSLSLALSFYIIVFTWQSIHVYFLNGIGKIRLQLYLVIISGLVNIPLAIFLGKRLGLAGITLSNAILFVVMGIIFSIQVEKLINNNAKGIWGK